MSTETSDNKPQLAALVQAGDQQTEAVKINDFIFMARDISNAYLVTTDDGDVMINAGFINSAERNQSVIGPVRTGPLKYIILTQAHADHFGGVPVLREAITQIITEHRFVDTWTFFDRLGPYLKGRSGKLWTGTIKGRDKIVVPEVTPDIEVIGQYDFELGGRRFDVISTPGGEAPDAMVVWMPREKVVFTGNLFGPVFLSMPNLCTMRGDKPRSAALWLECLEKVRDLNAELLITGHGDPIEGADTIRANLDKMHGAVSYILNATLDGMNAGKDVHTLMRDIQLPEDLQIGEFHGKVSWAVRTIWEEYSGWFHMDYTTSLYAVPRASVAADLAELAGGTQSLAKRAQQKLEADQPLQALHLLEVALDAEPHCKAALTVKQAVLGTLLQQSGGSNLSETMWLKTELTATETQLG
ncbi:MBL fold metallo-hydrolase [Aestuariicella hydrocarbonica]|uniref:MBL fold metallo-hydrolase n=1 Tax=Pseudomaricurvus hydrocarbonicus TaxID=1470433 RepID=A0A9E5JV58_9GAMM|nr:MBL fold metallo-hydrolase [Aestuariicella hydrocarbonica]NHO66031.1 MBL fold metallo-hydrolase [Aestuariicella hydrocarbonica]